MNGMNLFWAIAACIGLAVELLIAVFIFLAALGAIVDPGFRRDLFRRRKSE